MALIFVASSISRPPQLPVEGAYTGLHVLEYAGLSALLVRALAGGSRARIRTRTAVIATLVATLYGATDEVHQYFVPGRQMNAIDLAADALGATLAAGLLSAWRSPPGDADA
jgi:VanZ family protein